MVDPEVTRAFVLGGSGFVGLAVARRLLAEGYSVTGTCHSAKGEQRLLDAGIRPMRVDFDVAGPWLGTLGRADVVVYALHERAGRRLGQGWLRRSARLRDRVLPMVLEQLALAGTCRAFLYTSAIAAAGDHGEDWIDEQSPRVRSPLGDYHARSEAMVLASCRQGVPALALRPGFLYGPDGSFAEFFIEQARKGFYPYPGHGSNFLPWIHIDDLAAAYVLAARQPPVGEVLHVVDDEPLRLGQFAGQLLDAVGGGRAIGLPRFLVGLLAGSALAAMMSGSYRSGNQRARSALGWAPRYPTMAQGLQPTLDAWDKRQGAR